MGIADAARGDEETMDTLLAGPQTQTDPFRDASALTASGG